MNDRSDSAEFERSLAIALDLEVKAAAADTHIEELIETMFALFRLLHEGSVADSDEIRVDGRIVRALAAALRRIQAARPEMRDQLDQMFREIRPIDDPPMD